MYRFVTTFCALFFLFALPLFSSVPDSLNNKYTPTLNENLLDGIESYYQTDWGKADHYFQMVKEEDPSDPRPYFFEAMMPFLEYFFVEQTETLANYFLEKSEQAVELSSERLEESPNDTTMVLLLSGLHGYRGLVAADQNNHRVALSSGLTGFNYTRKLLSIDTDRADARIGRGMFYYMVGSIPSGMKWAANIVGLSAETEDGFAELKKAAESNTYIRNDALMMLMYLYSREEEYTKAVQYAEELTTTLPDNVIFLYKKAEIYEQLGDRDRAVSTYKRIVELDNDHLQRVTELSQDRIKNLEKKMIIGSK
jgi:tetratricopeptide (TPR) repeat protein